jgi:hypothetical protein
MAIAIPSRKINYPMNRFLKTLMLWLLLAALPLQGVAAAMQTPCGLMKHGDPAETAMSVQLHQHGGEVMTMSDTVATDIGAAAPAMSHDASPGDDHEHGTCSACASCCMSAAAPPAAAVITPTYSNSLPSVVTPAPLLTGFVPAGLERPPKRINT